jgi:hypothetical protein
MSALLLRDLFFVPEDGGAVFLTIVATTQKILIFNQESTGSVQENPP